MRDGRIAHQDSVAASALATRRQGLVFLAEPIAAARHVNDDENGEGGEHHEIHGVHQIFSRRNADVSV